LSITTAPWAAARGACSAEIFAAGREQRDVGAGEVERVQELDRELLPAERDLAARRALARQRHHLARRELARAQDRQHGLADRAGRTHDRHLELPFAHVSPF
jgi:hypothetical protein